MGEQGIFGEMHIGVASLLQEMPGGFFIYHAEGDERLTYANDACLRIFGCDTLDQFKALTGFTFPGMVHPDDIDAVEQSISRQISSDRHKMDYVEYRIVAADGSVRWIEDYGHYVATESGNFFYVFINDATDRLRERMERLEQVNAELNDAYEREHEHKEMLRRALAQANAGNVAKTTFLNNMSHNIRTLLNAVSGYAHLIVGRPGETERVGEYAQHIAEASDQLLEVVSETLEVSRLESGNSQLVEEECNLGDVVAGIRAAFAPRAQDEGKAFSCEVRAASGGLGAEPGRASVEPGEPPAAGACALPPILVDVHCLTQIVVQLVDNAFKYTAEGDAVELLVEQATDAAEGVARIAIRLADTGVGMAPDFIQRMYEPFERSGNTTDTGIIGTGLGLTIVRYLVDLLSGAIEVESVEGEGTTVDVALTAKLAPCADAAPAGKARTPGRRRVLVVEDNAFNREIATSLLEEFDHVVTSVTNGREAVELVANSRPGDFDVILMDIQMPVMNGYEAASRIRALDDAALASIPIIAVTSDAFPEDRKRSFSCGMNAHISKPINIDALNAAIESVM